MPILHNYTWTIYAANLFSTQVCTIYYTAASKGDSSRNTELHTLTISSTYNVTGLMTLVNYWCIEWVYDILQYSVKLEQAVAARRCNWQYGDRISVWLGGKATARLYYRHMQVNLCLCVWRTINCRYNFHMQFCSNVSAPACPPMLHIDLYHIAFPLVPLLRCLQLLILWAAASQQVTGLPWDSGRLSQLQFGDTKHNAWESRVIQCPAAASILCMNMCNAVHACIWIKPVIGLALYACAAL